MMKWARWWITPACVAVTLAGLQAKSGAFETKLTQEQMKEAIEYGAKYKGTDVFGSTMVKRACFGGYPGGEGGIVMSKYIHAVVISAMMNLKDKAVTEEKLREIEELTTFKVIVIVSEEEAKTPEDVQIILTQGTNNTLPQKTELGMKRKDYKQSIDATFMQDKINPRSNTTIVVKTRKDEKRYKIDFSDIK